MDGFAATRERRQVVFTAGQRWNVKAIVAYSVVQGTVFVVDDPVRFPRIAWGPIQTIMPMRGWGITLLIGGVLLATSYLTGKYLEWPLTLLCAVSGAMSIGFIVATISTANAPNAGVLPYATIAAMCYSSIASTVQARLKAEVVDRIRRGELHALRSVEANEGRSPRTEV